MSRTSRARATAIIPARLGSTRFPGKVLAADTGKPMVQHVVEAAARAESVSRVVVACDDERIGEALKPFGTEVVMTRADHPNGTSRLHEAAETLKLKKHHMIVNVQGDEPEIEPEIIDAAVLAANSVESIRVGFEAAGPTAPWIGTVASPFAEGEDPQNPAIVKAVVGLRDSDTAIGQALYFSRSPVPFNREGGIPQPPLKHVGIYAYPVWALKAYTKLAPTPLEQAEQLEQLRWLECGYPIAVAVRQTSHHGIDTPEQYAEFVARYRGSRGG
ncbi:MAG: 3-deoxy-manno-octulosonate cytidylyltransferase (CMP-KDO synthetase) [Phycisphaerales bacterium]|jgi:3-deoxy-manno-octulosonate cytidylyltransferase (CMP-KDO synthetase)